MGEFLPLIDAVSVKTVRRIGAASLIVPTIDHLTAPTLTMLFAPTVMTTTFGPSAVAAAVFFISLGLFQIISIGIIMKSNNHSLLALGILGNLGSILIYFISTSGVAIFGVPPQPLIPFGILIKALEAVFVAASTYLLVTCA
jgi:hypothetical protein